MIKNIKIKLTKAIGKIILTKLISKFQTVNGAIKTITSNCSKGENAIFITKFLYAIKLHNKDNKLN